MSDSPATVSVQQSHKITGGKETYQFNLKDRPTRQAVEISNPDKSPLNLQWIRISKIHGQNNKIIVELLKAI